MQRSHSIFLKDNPNLKPLFTWLQNLKIKTAEDFQSDKLKKLLDEIKFNTELKFYLSQDIPMLVFHNMLPLQADFNTGIVEYMNLLYQAMYQPEEVYLDGATTN